MQTSIFIFGLLASIVSAIPAPMTETTCQNEFSTCEVNAPYSSPNQCCISNMVCEPLGGFQSNSTMGTCVKQDDVQQN
ncbi:hypothetical protein N7540_009896 [Penicillium herquei]|nr:hypothetical protein N7540_009896 [Penicillium herquei]